MVGHVSERLDVARVGYDCGLCGPRGTGERGGMQSVTSLITAAEMLSF